MSDDCDILQWCCGFVSVKMYCIVKTYFIYTSNYLCHTFLSHSAVITGTRHCKCHVLRVPLSDHMTNNILRSRIYNYIHKLCKIVERRHINLFSLCTIVERRHINLSSLFSIVGTTRPSVAQVKRIFVLCDVLGVVATRIVVARIP
jgi:hypothetical protein